MLIIVFIFAFVLTFVPYINKYLTLINTFFHESGHALTTLLTGGRNKSISLFKNGSGLAVSGTPSSFSRFFVLLSGYTSASATGYGLYFALSCGYVSLVFWFFSCLILINLIFWIRNWFGFAWLLSLLGVFSLLYFYAKPQIIETVLLFFAFVLIIESSKSAWAILKLSYKNPANAGDATYLRDLTKVPALFWGVLFFVQGCFFAGLSILHSIS